MHPLSLGYSTMLDFQTKEHVVVMLSAHEYFLEHQWKINARESSQFLGVKYLEPVTCSSVHELQ